MKQSYFVLFLNEAVFIFIKPNLLPALISYEPFGEIET